MSINVFTVRDLPTDKRAFWEDLWYKELFHYLEDGINTLKDFDIYYSNIDINSGWAIYHVSVIGYDGDGEYKTLYDARVYAAIEKGQEDGEDDIKYLGFAHVCTVGCS